MKLLTELLLLTLTAILIQACKHVKKGLSQAEKNELVKSHNEMRQKVATGKQSGQPTASNMMELKWDDDLANEAQKLADSCQFSHTPYDQRFTSTYNPYGQNLYWASGSGGDAATAHTRQAVENWYGEVVKPGFNYQSTSYGGGAGHYTQLIWGKTKAVGCGFTAYDENGMTSQIIACNYGPAGNYQNQFLYESGAAGSKCPGGQSKSYAGLCAW